MPVERIVIDNLHLRLSNVWSMLKFIREHLQRFSYSANEKFLFILRKEMGEYYIDCYETGKNLACMHGEQIEQFLHLVPFVAHFFSTEVEQTSISKATLDILKCYPAIDQFLRITKVADTSSSIEMQNSQKLQHEQDITKFKSNLLNYQKAATLTTLTSHATRDSENFYAHALHCYYPQLVDKV